MISLIWGVVGQWQYPINHRNSPLPTYLATVTHFLSTLHYYPKRKKGKKSYKQMTSNVCQAIIHEAMINFVIKIHSQFNHSVPSHALLAWMQSKGWFHNSYECQWSFPMFELSSLICGVKLKCYRVIRLKPHTDQMGQRCQPSPGQNPWEQSKGSEGPSQCLQWPLISLREGSVSVSQRTIPALLNSGTFQ